MLIITEISNETPNKLSIHAILCRIVTIFYRQELVSLFEVQEKLKGAGIQNETFRVPVSLQMTVI